MTLSPPYGGLQPRGHLALQWLVACGRTTTYSGANNLAMDSSKCLGAEHLLLQSTVAVSGQLPSSL